MSDRFSELSDLEAGSRETEDTDYVDEPDEPGDTVDGEVESESEPESKPEPELQAEPDRTGDIQETAFNYDEAKQSPIYARPSTWDTYDDALELDIERSLRDQNVRNASKRELHDATLRLAAEHPELVAEKLLEARRES